MWKSCGKLKRWLATRCWDDWLHKFCLKLRGERCKRRWTCRGDAYVFLDLGIWGDFKYFDFFKIHGFGSGSKLGDVEGCSIGGGVGADWSSCTLRGCETGSNLGADTGMIDILWSWRFSLWVCDSSGGKGKICKRGWDVLLWKMWAIWLIALFCCITIIQESKCIRGVLHNCNYVSNGLL